MNESKMIECQCINEYRGKVYALSRKGDLFVCETDPPKMQYIYNINANDIYGCSCLIKNRIFYFPVISNTICIFDIEKDSIDYVPIMIHGVDRKLKECWNCADYNGFLYVTCGSGSEPLVRIDPVSFEAESLSEWNQSFRDKFNKQAVCTSYNGLCLSENILWLPLNAENVLLRFDLRDYSYRLFETNNKNNTIFHTVISDGNYLWLTGENEAVFRLDTLTDECVCYNKFPIGFEYRKDSVNWKGIFSAGRQAKSSIIYTPLEGNMFIKFDKETGEMNSLAPALVDKYCFHVFPMDDGRIYAEMDEKTTKSRCDSVMIDATGKIIDYAFSKEWVYEASFDRVKVNNCNKKTLYYEDYRGMLKSFLNTI